MAIAATRFNFLDQQTNVPYANLLSQNSSDLLNTPSNDLKTLGTNISNLLSSNAGGPIQTALQNPSSILSALGLSLNQPRITKNVVSSGISLLSVPANVINNAAASLAGVSPLASNLLKTLGTTCKASLLASANFANGPNPLIKCPTTGSSRRSSNTACNLNQFAALISAQSGGNYAPEIIDNFNAENAASLLGIAGYKQGLCNVFSALTGSLTNVDSISRIASSLLGSASSSGDITSVIDIGKSLLTGNVTGIIPGISSMIFSNFSIPSGTSNSALPSLYSGLSSAMGNIDGNWATSADGLLSSTNLGGSTASNSSAISSVMLSDSAVNGIIPSTTGSVSGDSTSSYLLAANQFPQNSVSSDLTNSTSSLFSF